MLPEVYHVPYANPYRMDGDQAAIAHSLAALEDLFTRQVSPDDVAGIFIEPIQGEGGYVIPPMGFLRALRELCDRHGIMLVADEVQSGVGRTGKMWACDWEGLRFFLWKCQQLPEPDTGGRIKRGFALSLGKRCRLLQIGARCFLIVVHFICAGAHHVGLRGCRVDCKQRAGIADRKKENSIILCVSATRRSGIPGHLCFRFSHYRIIRGHKT